MSDEKYKYERFSIISASCGNFGEQPIGWGTPCLPPHPNCFETCLFATAALSFLAITPFFHDLPQAAPASIGLSYLVKPPIYFTISFLLYYSRYDDSIAFWPYGLLDIKCYSWTAKYHAKTQLQSLGDTDGDDCHLLWWRKHMSAYSIPLVHPTKQKVSLVILEESSSKWPWRDAQLVSLFRGLETYAGWRLRQRIWGVHSILEYARCISWGRRRADGSWEGSGPYSRRKMLNTRI